MRTMWGLMADRESFTAVYSLLSAALSAEPGRSSAVMAYLRSSEMVGSRDGDT